MMVDLVLERLVVEHGAEPILGEALSGGILGATDFSFLGNAGDGHKAGKPPAS